MLYLPACCLSTPSFSSPAGAPRHSGKPNEERRNVSWTQGLTSCRPGASMMMSAAATGKSRSWQKEDASSSTVTGHLLALPSPQLIFSHENVMRVSTSHGSFISPLSWAAKGKVREATTNLPQRSHAKRSESLFFLPRFPYCHEGSLPHPYLIRVAWTDLSDPSFSSPIFPLSSS